MRALNLMPVHIRQRWEWQRQSAVWLTIWVLTTVLLWLVFNIFQQRQWEVHNLAELEAAQVQIVAQATPQIQALQAKISNTRRIVDNAQLLELTDVPLALLQTLIECCLRQGHGIQLDSIRLDELGVTAIKDGEVTPARKQLVISGLADSDPRATSFINSLQDSQLFEIVELLSIQDAGGERQYRTFSIRCEQKL